MCEVKDDRNDEVEVLENLEDLLVASFKSTNRVVDACFKNNRSGLGLWDEWDRSFKNKVGDEGRSTLDDLLDGDGSRLGNLEGNEGSSKVVNSFIKTEEMLLRVVVEWNDELALGLLVW